MATEVPLMKEFLGTYRHLRVRLFRRNIVNQTVADIHTGKVHQVKAGINGQADVYGYVIRTRGSMYAVNVEVEFKGVKTRVTKEQIAWQEFCASWQIPHIVLRAMPNEETADTLGRWIAELDAFVNGL